MVFYVPLGPRGGVLRLGTFVIGILGGMAYRQTCRRRDMAFSNPTLPVHLLDALAAE
ncbi:hypothetical protein [Paludisphaera borealis]|uniref:Uncharacterized protein n=1 Tax=Paludisphaera borealis TaxID=1387353 RepID=A0A1U7CKF7_9BACT|nr:hypothetical protein [Paludisphaera borealis]APW59424.1 hypothetical protein BSF38_00847 [Paludisphaera borealis]